MATMTGLRILAAAACAGALAAGAADAGSLSGDRHSITVIDGDTLQIDGRVIQLYGIDAPELGQLCLHGAMTWHCGLDAAYDLRKLVQMSARPIRCAEADATSTPPAMACQIDNRDISYDLVDSGIVVAAPDAGFALRRAEAHARDAGLGVWGSTFVPPWEWRQGKRLDGTKLAGAAVCVVKGSLAPDGRRLYFTPLDDAYDAIALGGTSGGVLFCSDEAARAAGYAREGEARP